MFMSYENIYETSRLTEGSLVVCFVMTVSTVSWENYIKDHYKCGNF